MIFGLDGVEVGLIIVFLCLFGSIMSGFPVAFSLGGTALGFAFIGSLTGAFDLLGLGSLANGAHLGGLIGGFVTGVTAALLHRAFPSKSSV